ncbi:MAG: hypothetical protein M0Z96_04890 [Actinomycetota bacterium]|nr:hypothetical protein [Actinomycetota bacterium]
MSSKDSKQITREDLEAKLREIHGEVSKAVDSAKPAISAVVVAAGVTVLAVSFLIGMRTGRKKNTIVEIRRI